VVSVRAFNQVGKGPVVYDLVYTTDTPSGNGQNPRHTCSRNFRVVGEAANLPDSLELVA